MSRLRADMIGRSFGRLTVLRASPVRDKDRNGMRWVCLCSCGTRRTVSGTNLRAGNTRSCGCLRRELATARAIERWSEARS